MPYKFYLDNLLTSLHFLYYLKNISFESNDMIRENRVPKNRLITEVKKFKKNNRNKFKYASTKDKN